MRETIPTKGNHGEVPKSDDWKFKYYLLRQRNELIKHNSPIWTDKRLEIASKGISALKQIYEQASEALKSFIRTPRVIQIFTGVTPVTLYSTENNIKDESDEKQNELVGLLQQHSPWITIRKVDYRQVPLKGFISIELMNEEALKVVSEENPGFFEELDGSISLWLEQNPHLWPGTILGLSEEHLKAEIRYGLLSGFPRSACEMYAQEISRKLRYKNPLQSILMFFAKKSNDTRIKRLDNDKVREISYKAGLWYVHYTEEHLKWTQDALDLLRVCLRLLNINLES